MTTNWKMGQADYDGLTKELGPLGIGIYYLWNAFAPAGQWGEKLSGWCLACNHDDDLVFLKTEGYYSGYLWDNPADGPHRSTFKENSFRPSGIDLKSRESEARFMVLRLSWSDATCTRAQLLAYAKWWNGYEVTGEEKDYYMALIKAGREEQAKRERAKREQEEKAQEYRKDMNYEKLMPALEVCKRGPMDMLMHGFPPRGKNEDETLKVFARGVEELGRCHGRRLSKENDKTRMSVLADACQKIDKLYEQTKDARDKEWKAKLMNAMEDFSLGCRLALFILREIEIEDKEKRLFLIAGEFAKHSLDHMKEEEKRHTVDYTGHAEIPDSLAASEVFGPEQSRVDDIKPMGSEYDESNVVIRGNVLFIPALPNDIARPFQKHGSSFTVICCGIANVDCTLYLLAPTMVFKSYRSNVLSSGYATHEDQDTLFDQNIDGLKRWAPEGTRFTKVRVQLESDNPVTTFWSISRNLLHIFMDEPNPAPAGNFSSRHINDTAKARVQGFLGDHTNWYQNAVREANRPRK